MTFLQTSFLWFLAFAALPVIIHLVNRMRFTQRKWAAMSFLDRARRKSTKMAKLREILILALRVLALLALGLALARPLSGGWLGWAAAGAPDTLVIVLDRSASMTGRDDNWSHSKLAQAAETLGNSAAKLGARRIVLIDSASPDARTLQKAEDLKDSVLLGDTDSGTDMPKLLERARAELASPASGRSELWIASDLQTSSWNPRSEQWSRWRSGIETIPGRPQVRLLAMTSILGGNASIQLINAVETSSPAGRDLELDLLIRRSESSAPVLNCSLKLDGLESSREIKLSGAETRCRQVIRLKKGSKGGWGSLSLPSDSREGDNTVYFAYGEASQGQVAVASADALQGELLSLLGAPAPEIFGVNAVILNPADPDATMLAKSSLLIWNATPPTAAVLDRVKQFVADGGCLLMLPPGSACEWGSWLNYGGVEDARNFRVSVWDDERGPLSKSASGKSLSMEKLGIARRQIPVAEGATPVASFSDGQPFLLRCTEGKGMVYALAAGIDPASSDLRQGTVLLPLLRRLQQEGGRRFTRVEWASCHPESGKQPLEALAVNRESIPKTASAGVWRRGDAYLVCARPEAEDDAAMLDSAEVESLFNGLEFTRMDEGSGAAGASQESELWRLFFALLLASMLVEGLLTLRRPLNEKSAGSQV
ncbi:MAG: hypothetical protein RL095_2813 [Verrucomicrobiota bacterium]|jgi:hypothetical protein